MTIYQFKDEVIMNGTEEYFSKLGFVNYNTYLNLYRFKVNTEEGIHIVTSIGLLRRTTGYSKKQVYDAIKRLLKYKLIKVLNVSRWDRFLEEDKKIPDHHTLEIEILPINKSCTYSDINISLYNHYLSVGLNIKHYMLYRILLLNPEININELAKTAGFDKTVVNKMIHQMNRKYVLYSEYCSNSYANRKFKHHLLTSYEDKDNFMNNYKVAIIKNITVWDKKAIQY